MDLVARKKLNLEVLKRHDANICDILDQSAHAVVYKFDTDKASWEKLGYEGVIFLTQGKSAPYFGLYVLNRLSIENFSLHLTDFEEINLTDEFIIYQTSEGEACALWLFEKKDRERILAKIQKLHEGMKALPSAMKPKAQQQQPAVESKGMDLLQMLKSGTAQQPQQQQAPPTESKLNLLQMLKQASNNNTSPHVNNNNRMKSPLDTVGNDLLSVLSGGQQQNMPPSIPAPHDNEKVYLNNASANTSDSRSANRLQELFDNSNNNNGPQGVPPHQRRIVANGELTKPFYPPGNFNAVNNGSPVNSPLAQARNTNPGALLQALHGGLIQPPLPPPPPPHYLMNHPHPYPAAAGLLAPQQVMGLMRPELARRFPNGRPTLSKPEFIQQLLNMIQCDPTFFDILYENYQQQQQQGPPMGPNNNMPIPHPAPPLAPSAPHSTATFSNQQQQQQQMQ